MTTVGGETGNVCVHILVAILRNMEASKSVEISEDSKQDTKNVPKSKESGALRIRLVVGR